MKRKASWPIRSDYNAVSNDSIHQLAFFITVVGQIKRASPLVGLAWCLLSKCQSTRLCICWCLLLKCLSAGNGSYILWPGVHDLWGTTITNKCCNRKLSFSCQSFGWRIGCNCLQHNDFDNSASAVIKAITSNYSFLQCIHNQQHLETIEV